MGREIVLRQLSMMSRSREQLRTKLLDKGVSEDVAARILDRFESVGLVDDAAYADAVVRTQRESRGLSRRGLAAELKKRGVDGETAAAAVGAVGAAEEYSTALQLALKKARSTQGMERAVRERRIAGMLARKGYGAAVSYRAMREALAADSGNVDPETV